MLVVGPVTIGTEAYTSASGLNRELERKTLETSVTGAESLLWHGIGRYTKRARRRQDEYSLGA
jgi:hypothetical protein